jgi:hypothetical protein
VLYTICKDALLRAGRDIPWLAVRLLPAIGTLTPATLSILGDLERYLTWALIESE